MDVIARYAQTFLWLQRYEEGLRAEPKGAPGGTLGTLQTAHETRAAIARLKADLIARADATPVRAARVDPHQPDPVRSGKNESEGVVQGRRHSKEVSNG